MSFGGMRMCRLFIAIEGVARRVMHDVTPSACATTPDIKGYRPLSCCPPLVILPCHMSHKLPEKLPS